LVAIYSFRDGSDRVVFLWAILEKLHSIFDTAIPRAQDDHSALLLDHERLMRSASSGSAKK
jgi:hypothetical protein